MSCKFSGLWEGLSEHEQVCLTRLLHYNSDFHKHHYYRNVNLSKELCKTRCNDLLKHANINEIHHIWQKQRAQSATPFNSLRQLMSLRSLQEPVSTLIKGHYEAFWMLNPFDYVTPDSFVVTNNVPSCVWDHSRAEDLDCIQPEAFQKIFDGDYNLTVLSCLHYSVSFNKTAKHHKPTNCPKLWHSLPHGVRQMAVDTLLHIITNDSWTKYFTFRFLVHDAYFMNLYLMRACQWFSAEILCDLVYLSVSDTLLIQSASIP